jgi:ATP-dependent Lhr-like helicase
LAGGFVPEALFHEVRAATSYRDLSREEFDWALALAEHGGATLGAYAEQHRLRRVGERCVVSTPRAAQLHRLNIGTIVADASLEIRYQRGKSLGRIDEGFVAHLRPGERFVFAGKVLSFVCLRDLVVYVKPAPGSTMHTPIWAGTRLPISESLSRAMRDAIGSLGRGDRSTPEFAAAASLARVQQRESLIPGPDETLIELTTTCEGRHLFIFPFEGRLVHAGIAALLALRLSRHQPMTLAIAANDYGFELLGPPDLQFESWLTDELFSTTSLAADVVESLNLSELARLQFREVARVAGLIQQNYPGAAKTGRQVQASAGLLFDVFSEFEPENLLLQQARREVLERHFEHSRLARTLARIGHSHRRVVCTTRPTPLSFPILVERQAAKLSTESIAQRVERMMSQWEQPPSPSSSPASASP